VDVQATLAEIAPLVTDPYRRTLVQACRSLARLPASVAQSR